MNKFQGFEAEFQLKHAKNGLFW